MVIAELLLKLVVGTGFFIFTIFLAQLPYPLVQRAAGMMLTFPLLNGIALVMTDTSQTALKVSTMIPMIAFNGLMCFGIILNFERLNRLWRTPHLPLFIASAATAVWFFVKFADFTLPPDWQGRYVTAYGVLALWLLLGFLPERAITVGSKQPLFGRNNLKRFGIFAGILIVVLIVGLRPEWSSLTGQLSAFPLPGVFALYVISSNTTKPFDERIQTLRQLRSTVLLGPIIAMTFVLLLWPYVGQRPWGYELIGLVVPAWIGCLVVIFIVSAAFGFVEKLRAGQR